MEAKKIGIVGAGVMGRGVAQSFAQFGYEVLLLDKKSQVLENAKLEIGLNVRLQSLIDRKSSVEDEQSVLSRILFTVSYDELKNVSFLVENVAEIIDTKRSVYEQLDEICNDSCIFAVNTSCISITQIAALTKRPDRVIGVHFMNPVPQIAAVEVIKGFHTSPYTIDETVSVLQSVKKKAIIVNDFPGFVSNRISHLMMNEAAFVVQDNVACPEVVDEIFKECYGHKLGPLETADLIGLDTVRNSLDILYDSYQDPKFRCCPLLKKMVDAGLLGKKSGRGFYEYNP